MSSADHLASPRFARLFRQVRQRLEREPHAPPTARTSLRDPSPEERRALEGLLGNRFTGRSVSATLGDLDQALVAATGEDLRAWLVRLGGPLRDRPAEAEGREWRIAAAVDRARSSPLARQAWFRGWLESLRGAPLSRLASEEQLDRLSEAVCVLEALPADDVPIALFASDHAGGTKALDGTPLERLVLSALAAWQGVARPEDAGDRRDLWARVGVVPDDLAAQVLVLNLPATGDGPLDRMLREAAGLGMPLRLTLHQLTHFPPTLDPSAGVFVCENPAVLRLAAERMGAGCAPLVATEGRPSTAFWRLLARVSGPVRVRADFDKDGVQIVADVLSRVPTARPWRFDLATYHAAPHTDVPLPATMPSTPWDPALAQAMAGRWRVEEEQVLAGLLENLGAQGAGSTRGGAEPR